MGGVGYLGKQLLKSDREENFRDGAGAELLVWLAEMGVLRDNSEWVWSWGLGVFNGAPSAHDALNKGQCNDILRDV